MVKLDFGPLEGQMGCRNLKRLTAASMSTWLKYLLTKMLCLSGRDGSASKMCTSGGRQCKTLPIPEFRDPAF